jgi:hypothetical protein
MNIGGKKVSGWWVVGGAAGLGAAFLIYRHFGSEKAPAAASSSSPASIDPVTGMPYSMDDETDPATGLTYLAEAQEYGSVQAAEEEISSGSAYYGQTGTGTVDDAGYPTIYPATTTAAGSYSSNAAWAQAVTAGLAAIGYDSGTVSAALGAFFTQMPLSSSQAGIIQAAEAEYGPPPQGTYSIIPQPSTSTTATSSTPSTPYGFTGSVQDTSGAFAWGQAPNTQANWTITQNGTVVDSAASESNSSGSVHISVGNLKAKTAYVLTVTANGGTGTFNFTTF